MKAFPLAGIEIVDGPLAAWLASRAHAAPDTLRDFAVTDARVKTFRQFAYALSAANWSRAIELLNPLQYQLVAIKDGQDWFVAAFDNSSTGRDPTLVVNIAPRRDFVVQAPHVPFEWGTGEQAAILLRALGGRAAIVSGAHRCASRTFTACDGRTDVCSRGTLQGYRDSDPSHNVGTLFHAAHVVFASRWSNSIVISLHEMGEDKTGARTSVILSNGARSEDRVRTAATRLRLGLARKELPAGKVVSCNMPSDDKYRYRRLCGLTNVQGRHVNGDTNPCRGSIDKATGRFIHVEQDRSVLRPYVESWSKIDDDPFSRMFIETLGRVLPAVRMR